MTQDSYASDQEGASLSEDALDIYFFFYDSRSHRGVPRRTRTEAQHAFGLKWQAVKALMQEIEDAGYWRIAQNGAPEFTPGMEPERPGLDTAPTRVGVAGVGVAGVRMRACPESKSFTTNNVTPLPLPLRGNSGAQQRPIISHLSEKGFYRLARVHGKDVRDLIDEFSYLIRKANGGFAPDPINTKALGGNFRRWLTIDQMTFPVIKRMIHIFVEDYAPRKKGAPAWKLFLSQKEKLYTQAKERSDRQSTTDYWKRKIEEAGT